MLHQKTIFSKATELVAANQLFISHAISAVHAASIDIIREQGNILVSLGAAIKELAIKNVYDQQQLITDKKAQIKRTAENQFNNAKHQLQNYSQLVKHLSPASVLKRGYALVYQQGKLVTSAKDVRVGTSINTMLADATIDSTVTSINKEHE
jgi:exodeoxyribonuclease VII large subunit